MEVPVKLETTSVYITRVASSSAVLTPMCSGCKGYESDSKLILYYSNTTFHDSL
jgi:hypothetical protein